MEEQFIEEKLTAKGRTTARLLKGMIEELEAISMYGQRISAEPDAETVAALTSIQREEMKHFAMQLELVLRRDPDFKTICEGILFQEGDVVELGDAAEKKVD